MSTTTTNDEGRRTNDERRRRTTLTTTTMTNDDDDDDELRRRRRRRRTTWPLPSRSTSSSSSSSFAVVVVDVRRRSSKSVKAAMSTCCSGLVFVRTGIAVDCCKSLVVYLVRSPPQQYDMCYLNSGGGASAPSPPTSRAALTKSYAVSNSFQPRRRRFVLFCFDASVLKNASNINERELRRPLQQ